MMKLCKRCSGAGFLFRPQPHKLVTFRRCMSCVCGVRGKTQKAEV